MLLPRLSAALLLATTTAHAFKDALPFVLLSSDSLQDSTLQSQQISRPTDLEHDILSSLSRCDRSRYIVYTQPGLRAEDFRHMPKLQKRMRKAQDGKGLVEVPAVLDGGLDMRFAQRLTEQCGLDKSQTQHMTYSPLPALRTAEERSRKLSEADSTIAETLRSVEVSGESYIFIFSGLVSTSDETESRRVEDHQDPPYEMDEPFPSGLHTEMKRDTEHLQRDVHARAANGTEDPQSGLPLFEKYMFLSPPLFMGLTVFLLLFLILYVALSAIANLEVSYFAFSKEFAQAGQKQGKQQ